MRPAVYASVVRNRKGGNRRLRPPQFSIRRLLLMVFIGALLLAPGLIFTVLGVDNDDPVAHAQESPASRVLHNVIGPVALALGIFILFSALLYYFCYGLADHSPRNRPASSKSNSSHQHHGDNAHDDHIEGEHKRRNRSTSKSPPSSHHNSHHHSHHKRMKSQSCDPGEGRENEVLHCHAVELNIEEEQVTLASNKDI